MCTTRQITNRLKASLRYEKVQPGYCMSFKRLTSLVCFQNFPSQFPKLEAAVEELLELGYFEIVIAKAGGKYTNLIQYKLTNEGYKELVLSPYKINISK